MAMSVSNIPIPIPTTSTKKDLVAFLKSRHLKSSFRRKEDLLQFLHSIRWSLGFPWRDEQRQVIDCFEKLSLKDAKGGVIGVQGLFGCGKTTLLLGMLNRGYWRDMFRMDEVCFCAFNVCIKEEIRRKVASWGCKDKVMVRTFDSLIYECCRYYGYPYLKLPNYKGKRLFVYKKCDEWRMAEAHGSTEKVAMPRYDAFDHIKYLFVDECQDLERQSFDVFRTFFPNACIVFVGDIFQSVQKEPRESLLWYISQTMRSHVHYFYMKDTPRVPVNVLTEIQGALRHSYPEYASQIMDWQSTNAHTNTDIEWLAFENYKDLYDKMFAFVESHPYHQSMILTFSSCITVRGSLGDLARVRRILEQKGYPVNKNYKSMDKDALFLSTANSSKGLERDYVFILSTFPLEKAFINFSNDLTTNLVTVALSRAKKKVVMCIPKDTSKFSTALYAYGSCPRPSMLFERASTTTKDGKKGAKHSHMNIPTEQMTMEEYFCMEHNVTELLRQNILQYETRMLFKSFVKKRIETKLCRSESDPSIPIPKSCLLSEEERSFVGVCLEVLMTTTWKRAFPNTPHISDIEQNPYYHHCISKIRTLRNEYQQLRARHAHSPPDSFPFFKTLFLYTELHIAIHHKMFFFFNVSQRQDLFRYWKAYRPIVQHHRPPPQKTFTPQSNVKMPLITGIADAILNDQRKHVYEIKASVKNDWKEDAFVQAFCYGIMLGQKWFHIQLMNLFKESKVEYVVYMDNVRHVRQRLLYDVMIWNASSYLAKNLCVQSSSQQIEDYLFVHAEWDVLQNRIQEIVVIRMLSPSRIHLEFHAMHEDERPPKPSNKDKDTPTSTPPSSQKQQQPVNVLDAFAEYMRTQRPLNTTIIHCCDVHVSEKLMATLSCEYVYEPFEKRWGRVGKIEDLAQTFTKEITSLPKQNVLFQTILGIATVLTK